MSEDGLSEPCDEPSMELFVESLTGTSFEMRVNPTDTVLDIKNKIFRVEGIPVPQQNLLFQMKELNDHSRLMDLGIVNGCTLRLVTAMRGGPISTRRWTSDHTVWKDLKDLIEHTREELGDKLGTKVSVLVFKEGEVIKWLRVIENEDGSYSPYNEQRAIAPPCSSSGSGGGCGIGNGGSGNSVGSRSGSKHYQHHKTSATDASTLSSNTIDFQDLMQFKQHASVLSSFYHQHHHHHHNHMHHHAAGAGTSAVMSGVGDQQHQQQHQHHRQQVYRRLEDDFRMKGRVNLLKTRMQRAKRNKGKAVVGSSEKGDANGLTEQTTEAEEIAIDRPNDNLILAAVLNDDGDDEVDSVEDAIKADLRLETLLRTLQNGDTLVPINDSYTSKYHRRTHSRNSQMLQLDTSQLPDDDLTLFKPIPTGHGNSKHSNGSSATCMVGSSNNPTDRSSSGVGSNNTISHNSGLNLLLMDCAASAAAARKSMSSNSSSCSTDSSSSSSSSSTTDLEVALKEKHRSNRLRLHATAVAMKTAAAANAEFNAMAKGVKTPMIDRHRLANSVDPTNSINPINITTATLNTSPPTQPVSLNNATSSNNYVCTNLHVFEPQRDVIAPGIRHDISPKRRGSKATAGAVIPTVAPSVGDVSRERLSLPDTKRRAKIGRLLNTTTTPGSGETSDSDDGLWSAQTTATATNRVRHYRPTAMRLILPDTSSMVKGKCGTDGDHSVLDDDQHVILPDIWEHHGTASAGAPSANTFSRGAGLLCARATTNTSPNTTDTMIASTTGAMDSVDANDSGPSAACFRDYMDLDSELDKMFSELRSDVSIPSIPSAIPPQYAPKDCQLYLGSPVVPRVSPTPSCTDTAASSKSAAISTTSAATAHRLSPMSTLPYHMNSLSTSPTVGTITRRSPLYHRRTTTTSTTGTTANGSTTDDDRAAIAAASRSMLEKVQRTAASEIGSLAGTVGDKTMRQRRRRYSTDDCEFTLERLQNDYVPDRFDYSDFDSYPADVDDMIGYYGQEAVVNARWMEAAAASGAHSSSSSTSPPHMPPTTRHRNPVRLRATPHRESLTDHHLHHHLCLAEQIQRFGLDLDTDDYRNDDVATSFSNTIGTRMGTSRASNDNTNNAIDAGEFAHSCSHFLSNGLPANSGNSGNNTKLPTLVEHRKQQQQTTASTILTSGAVTVVAPTGRTTAPRMRCAHCNRKLNITNIYDCRCGRIFCAQHRYSEVHDCAHDYKTEGRRLLAQQNPLVTAPKLAKF